MTNKSSDLLRELLQRKQQALQWQSASKPGNKLANKLANKQNRWQRFNRYVWDKKQG